MFKKNRSKNIARAILIFSVLMMVLFSYLSQKNPEIIFFSIMLSFFEASMVGGIADLFAIHVLFKKPFGLNIPHTEIIPKSKERIGKALSDFFRDNFLSENYVKETLNKYIISHKISLFLKFKKVYIVDNIMKLSYFFIRTINFSKINQLVNYKIQNLIVGVDFKKYILSFLEDIQHKENHYKIFEYLLLRLREWLDDPENNDKVNKWIESAIKSDGQGGVSFMGRIKSAFMGKQDIAGSVNELIVLLRSHEGTQLKKEINKVFSGLIDEIKTSKIINENIEEIKNILINNGDLSRYISLMIEDLKNWIDADLVKQNSIIKKYIEKNVDLVIYKLENDENWIKIIQEKTLTYLPDIIIKNGNKIESYITEYINKLDAKEISMLIEEKVGDDLQYIRINGSIVGGLIGVLIFLIKFGFLYLIS